ncbi:hypothetical protein DB459_04410 [Bradyrhizobium sp. WD16]|nr:hypothetical protein DB459_04410 [Bradyrhizobium sp. WD16]
MFSLKNPISINSCGCADDGAQRFLWRREQWWVARTTDSAKSALRFSLCSRRAAMYDETF